ncbi:hypothetical protein HYZ76_02135 [Candidatus Falkowbacteria bacterium]|nr:hypothetical protein [Candidatus Falkowbacteria bacterium]
MAVQTVTRSSGQKVQISLGKVARGRDSVSICFPGLDLKLDQRKGAGYNVALTFAKKVDERGSWVEVIDRQPISSDSEAVLHVSKPIFYKMARWACAILGSHRLILSDRREIRIPRDFILWDVYWQADDGNHLQGTVLAQSAASACDLAAELEIMWDNMYAVPSNRPLTVDV